MTGTFSQMYIRIVFAVKHRQALIRSLWEERLYGYITGIIRNKDQQLLAINQINDWDNSGGPG